MPVGLASQSLGTSSSTRLGMLISLPAYCALSTSREIAIARLGRVRLWIVTPMVPDAPDFFYTLPHIVRPVRRSRVFFPRMLSHCGSV